MNFKRLWTIFKTRNREFFRDRSAFGWNFLFPFLIIGGFAIIFGGREYTALFQKTRYMKFIAFQTAEQGLEKLKHHKIDFLIKNGSPTNEYWVSDTSPKGYIVEKIYNSSFMPQSKKENTNKKNIQGSEIRYIDWLFPGILAMNMMFSALWGVGFIIVRYRKNGVLKRLKVTPLTAFEYLSAQLLSRIYVLMFSLVIVWIGCDLVFSFKV
ncbi:MAG: ABC transporter permease, partial [Deltaproteobacteria bacterium]|nr:ABC transporter permease [Deltaproteobacteria bacterium]